MNTKHPNKPETITEAQRLLTRSEVARYFAVSKETIRRWEGRGMITPIVINARVYRYRLADINLNSF